MQGKAHKLVSPAASLQSPQGPGRQLLGMSQDCLVCWSALSLGAAAAVPVVFVQVDCLPSLAVSLLFSFTWKHLHLPPLGTALTPLVWWGTVTNILWYFPFLNMTLVGWNLRLLFPELFLPESRRTLAVNHMTGLLLISHSIK